MVIQLGIVGLGWVLKDFHLPHWDRLQNVQVSAITDIRPEAIEEASHFFPKALTYADPKEMILHAPIDALYLLLPPYVHGELESLAIQRGLPFFIEKPVALDLSLARQIEKDVAKAQLITSVGYHRRYSWIAEKIKEQLAGQKAALIHGSWLSTVPPIHWWGQQRLSGGQLIEQATHMIDLFRYFIGEVDSVFAYHDKKLIEQENFDVPDVSAVLFRFVNGALGTLTATCAMPSKHHRISFQIVAEQTSLEVWQEGLHVHTSEGTQVSCHHNLPEWNPFVREGNTFLEAVRCGDRSKIRSDYADAVRTLELALAARRSAETGEVVSLQNSVFA